MRGVVCVRLSVVCLCVCLVALGVWSSAALGDESPSLAGSDGVSLEAPLLGNEGARAAEETRQANPEAALAREESRTKYEGLSSEQAAKLAGEVFPSVVDRAAGGPPSLPVGARSGGFVDGYAERIESGDDQHTVVQSSVPIATPVGVGEWAAVNLGVSEVNGGFSVVNPVASVDIPRRLGEGVGIVDSGVSLTPVSSSGAVVGGSEGVVDGSVVFYGGAGAGSDVDGLVKPTVFGFDEDAVLRSANSPEQLSYRVGLPAGASLVQATSGDIQVVGEGTVIAELLVPGATDAAGSVVPVSVSLSGDVVTLAVAHRSSSYEYPIDVDPTIIDNHLVYAGSELSGWQFYTAEPESFSFVESSGSEAYLGQVSESAHPPTGADASAIYYLTQGASQIYGATGISTTEKTWEETAEYKLFIGSEAEKYEAIASPALPVNGSAETSLCVREHCGVPSAVEEARQGNAVTFEALHVSSKPGDFEAKIKAAAVDVLQEKGPSVSMDTSDEVVNGEENALYGGRWASATSGKWGFEAHASDPGMGIFRYMWSSPNAGKWGASDEGLGCRGLQCDESLSPGYGVAQSGVGAEQLPEGEDTVEAKVEDPVGLTATTKATVKVDDAPPYNIELTGLPSDHEIIDGQSIALKASATDGSGSTRSSGVASIVLSMDGQEVGSPSKGCSLGPCTASGEWTLNGEFYAAGKHTLTVTATDNAGNVAVKEFEVTVRHAGDVSIGPGAVNPVTGELALSAKDVAVSVPDGTLSVGRSYNSRHLTAGASGPLGPQWSISLGAQQSLTRTPSGSMVLASSSGKQTVFTSSGKGAYTPPVGDAGLTLSEKMAEGSAEFLLSEDGSVTTFTLPSGVSGTWVPSVNEGPNGTNAKTFSYVYEKGVIEPHEELAPVPAGVSCRGGFQKGCRALIFKYGTTTKASGENESQWNEFTGRLAKIIYKAYNPASKGNTEVTVAEYAYDAQGRLRAVWDPQISPALKMTYGYDSEGHVTALTPAGQQPWLLEMGTSVGDAAPGRLLAVRRPAASTEASNGELPVNTVAPTLSSSTPAVGSKISVAGAGTWSGSPLAYTYQWEDCNSSGRECTPIPGAVNQAYYPISSDEGHTLVAKVLALNGTGAVAALSAATGVVAGGTPDTPLPEPPAVGSSSVWTIEYQVPLSGSGAPYPMGTSNVAEWAQTDDPAQAMAIFAPDKPMGWPAKEYKGESVYYLDGRDRLVNTANRAGGISTSEYNTTNDVVRTLSADNRAAALKASKPKEDAELWSTESVYNGEGTQLESTLGPQHEIERSNGKHERVEARLKTRYFYEEEAPEGGPYHLATKITSGAVIAGKEEEEKTVKMSYAGQDDLGWKLHKPTSVTTAPSGLDLTRSTFYEPKTGQVTETRQPAAGAPGAEATDVFQTQFGKTGSGGENLKEPQGAVAVSGGTVYVLDTGDSRVKEFNSYGEFRTQFGEATIYGKALKTPEGIATDSEGDIWVADTGNNRVIELTAEGKQKADITGFSKPSAVAVGAEGKVWVANAGGNDVKVYEYRETYEEEEDFSLSKTIGSKGTGEDEFVEPQGIAIGAEGDVYVADTGNNRVEELSAAGKYVGVFGKEGSGNGQLKAPDGIATDSAGDVWVADSANNRIEAFSKTGTFLQTFGKEGASEGQLKSPKGVSVDLEGDVWVADSGNSNIQEWTAHGSGYGLGTPNTHETQTIYYTAEANGKVSTCGKHPEWASMPCQTQPAAQPAGSLPKLPVTTFTYNFWDEPETTTSTNGSSTRTTTDTYDSAGRPATMSISSTEGTALPKISYEYNKENGTLAKQSSSEGAISESFNKLGELTSYVDASEVTSTFTYDEDYRPKTINDGKGTQTFNYDSTTGYLDSVEDSSGITFTGTYSSEGRLLTEGYPNGMTATYTNNQTGEPIGLEYEKKTNCTSKCVWYSDKTLPSIQGQTLSQESTFSQNYYAYDEAGRLTQVQDTTEHGCTTRIYTLDADTNRTSLTTREPGSKGECISEGGASEKHSYDEADRLDDAGVAYNAFGDITTLPAADAGGNQLLSTYYTDSQLASQEQNGQSLAYKLDPSGRTLLTTATGKATGNTTSNYAGSGNNPSWTSNTGGEWTRNIPGINGSLAATQTNSEKPVLQLTNLHDDIIATATTSETATGLASKADTTEYGIPTTSLPPKYSWLGAIEIPTELPSGVTEMGVRSYVPQIGRFLQPDPIPGADANTYTYTNGDPLNETDPTGASSTPPQWLTNDINATATEGYDARKAQEEAAARALAEKQAAEAAELAAREAAWYTSLYGADQYEPEYEEYWEEYEEESGYESIANQSNGISGRSEAKIEAAVLFQPFGVEGKNVEDLGTMGSVLPLCKEGLTSPCTQFATWIHRVSGRTLKLACTFAAVAAFRCGGDDLMKQEQEYANSAAGQAAIVEEQRPSGDDDDGIWRMASEDGSIDDE
jgi:RHS repeat-associated protein